MFETCWQETASTTAWLSYSCETGSECKEYPTLATKIICEPKPVEPPVVVPAPPTPIPILSICELGTQKCVTNSTTLLTDTFDVCIQDTVTTTAWVNLQCAEGTSCGEYPSVSNRILCN
ncbi:hypothetical protein BASA60_000098 [Batrachochytrium salamandrivorans]|nr:hypothetical protein BASA60_000098 [Batrachochytrium salamandrivorans]